MVGWLPEFHASAGGVRVDGNAPPVDAPPEALTAKLTKALVPPMAAQLLAQFVVKAR